MFIHNEYRAQSVRYLVLRMKMNSEERRKLAMEIGEERYGKCKG